MPKKILLKGPLLTRSGYGEQARYALRALRSRPDLFEVYIQPLTWGQTSWINEQSGERLWIDKTIERTIAHIQQGGIFDLSLQVTIPAEWESIAKVNVGYTAGIETTQVSPEWIQKANEMDRVVVISNHAKDTFVKTTYQGVNEQTQEEVTLLTTVPMEPICYPVKTYETLPDIELDLKQSFNFLTVAQFGPRKNIANTIKWFVEEFQNEPVGLVVKTNLAKNCSMDREMLEQKLKEIINEVESPAKRLCRVYLLHGDMTDEEMHALYKHPRINALLALTHGEGFGLPLYEAAYSGVPVIAAGWSGHMDFLRDEKGAEHFYNVAFDLGPIPEEAVWDTVLLRNSMWAYPRESSSKEAMRQCHTDLTNPETLDATTKRFKEYSEVLQEKFTEEKLYAKFVDLVYGEHIDVNSWLDQLGEDIEEHE